MQAGIWRKTIATVGSGEVLLYHVSFMYQAPTLGNQVVLTAMAVFYLALTQCTSIIFGDNIASAYLYGGELLLFLFRPMMRVEATPAQGHWAHAFAPALKAADLRSTDWSPSDCMSNVKRYDWLRRVKRFDLLNNRFRMSLL